MRFRTEIELRPSSLRIDHSRPIVLLGSCFTDEIGARLGRDGFEVVHNPLGPLYNPLSVLNCLDRALSGRDYTEADLTPGPRGLHCLDFASRYSGSDAAALLAEINDTLHVLRSAVSRASAVFLTLGTAYVFERADSGAIVGNCHKFEPSFFNRRLISVAEAADALRRSSALVRSAGCADIVTTVSPIRHLADGAHGNTVSKSTLHLAVEAAGADYFPAYELLMDDLRDYRFYATDMKHPSEAAVDYIYSKFADAYFSDETVRRAREAERTYRSSQHRPIL